MSEKYSARVRVKILREGVQIPRYMTEGAAGFDLAAAEKVILMAGETALVPTGLAFEIPAGFELQVRPRGGTSFNTELRIKNAPGTVDSDYRGEVFIIVKNEGDFVHVIEKGERIAQGVLAPYCTARFVVEVGDLEQTDRGDGAFGSTGQ